jgi:hypothetical protein
MTSITQQHAAASGFSQQLKPIRWHRPLLWLAIASAVLAIVSVIGIIIDPRELVSAPLWAKPLKFALSTFIYAITWSWLIGQLVRFHRVAWWAGTVSAALLVVEDFIIVAAQASGVTSHFNVSTPLNIALWVIMAVSISIIWGATLLVSILLFRNNLGDPARNLAIRAGAIIAVAGIGVAFFMTFPTSAQLSDFKGIAGAHTVGFPDGGPSLPILGWSTVGGDLRVPHFVGMHALQIIPIALILIELLSRRVTQLRDPLVRRTLVAVTAGAYAAAFVLLTVQALRGQSIVAPDLLTITVAAVIVGATLITATITLVRARQPKVEITA